MLIEEQRLLGPTLQQPFFVAPEPLQVLPVSMAKSASSILDLAAVVNSTTFIRLDTVYSSLFCPAPHSALYPETLSIAEEISSKGCSAADIQLT